MKKNNLDNLLNAGKGAALSSKTKVKEYKTTKLVTSLDPEWERKFEENIKGKLFEGTYSAFIRTCIMKEINK